MKKQNNRNNEIEKLYCIVSDKIDKHGNEKLRGQGKILILLYNNGTTSQQEIQQLLDISSGSISEMVGKLVNKNYVIKTQDLQDRRRTMLTITDIGKNHVNEYRSKYIENESNVFEVLTDEEREQLLSILRKLI